MAEEDTGGGPGTVKVPGIGTIPKTYAYAGAALIAGIVGYAYWKRAQANKAAAAATPDPTIDPLTGLPYSAESGTSGGYVNPNPVTSINTATGTIQTNAQWVDAVVTSLQNLGMDPGAVSSALADYLQRVPLSTDEAAIVRQAWAWQGYPPQGPTTFTLSTGSSTPGGGTGGGSSTPPAVPSGLAVTDTTASSITLVWGAVTGATGYRVYKDGASVGSPNKPAWTSVGNAASTSHSFQVSATNSGGESAKSSAVTGTTKSAGGSGAPNQFPGVGGNPIIEVNTAKFTPNNPPWNSTLSGIAQHQGTTVAALLALNPSITNPNVIPFPGKIRVK